MSNVFLSPENVNHPMVRRAYALFTPPIDEFVNTLGEWIEDHVTGGYGYGVPRLGKSRAVKFWAGQILAERFHRRLALFRMTYKRHDRFSERDFLGELLDSTHHKHPGAQTGNKGSTAWCGRLPRLR
ncbi:hypothetical protein [Tunturiibacter gelidiferens]|uniref:hypothetical protein n=1 Tax=Tunturiibacter gelidiferens TaxID=3069689 RepID=UPI003D9BD800